ncbi:O-antigen ligase family protein [Tangfeifania diversioriginum]
MKYFLIAALLSIVLVPVLYTARVYTDYFDFKDYDPKSVETKTHAGNRYRHNFSEHARENGYLVYVYICQEELRQEWNKHSEIKYGDNLNGYPLSSTLIRYLTSLGYRKDSVGVSRLTPKDIKLIEQGVTNHKFDNRFFSIYPRIYETIWELDNYFRTGNPNNKSLAQRIEYIKASLFIIKENPWFGIGTGNWVNEYNKVYDQMDSKLDDEKRGPSHNQYLNYMVKFGIIGFLWILFAILYPVFLLGHRRNFIFVCFLIAIAFANLGDANLETHMGLSFFSFFYFLFLWNSTTEMKSSIVKR